MKKTAIQKTTIQPLGENVVVKVEEASGKVGSLYIPDPSNLAVNRGKVLAVGQGVYVDGALIGTEVSKGDFVLFERTKAQEVRHDGENLYVIRASLILAVIA